MPDWWAKAVVGDVEVDERAAHEDAGGVDLLVETVFAIDEEYVEALLREDSSTLKPGKSGANDGHVVGAGRHISSLRRGAHYRQVLYEAKTPGVVLAGRRLWSALDHHSKDISREGA